MDQNNSNKAYNYCIYLLAKQDYSEFKLRQKMRQKKYLPLEIDDTINKLQTRGLLREENYKRIFIKKWLQKGESPMKIRMRGKAEKLEFTNEDFETIQEDEGLGKLEALEKLVQKKVRGPVSELGYEEKQALKQKTFRFLMSKGYSYEDCNEAIKKFI